MGKILFGLSLVLAIVLFQGCTLAPAAPTPTPQPTPTPPPPTPTSLPEGVVVYEDPTGDCLNNADNAPIPCQPAGIDILKVTITSGSPLTFLLELAGTGVADLAAYGVVHGLDLDRDAATGNTSGWSELHGIAPDLVVFFSSQQGQEESLVVQYSSDGIGTELDPSLATWTILDDNHIQVVLAEELITGVGFGLAGDIFLETIYDHYVDDGHLLFPGGDVVLVQ